MRIIALGPDLDRGVGIPGAADLDDRRRPIGLCQPVVDRRLQTPRSRPDQGVVVVELVPVRVVVVEQLRGDTGLPPGYIGAGSLAPVRMNCPRSEVPYWSRPTGTGHPPTRNRRSRCCRPEGCQGHRNLRPTNVRPGTSRDHPNCHWSGWRPCRALPGCPAGCNRRPGPGPPPQPERWSQAGCAMKSPRGHRQREARR